MSITIAELLQILIDGLIDGETIPEKSEYIKTAEGIDLIPSDIRLAGVENNLLNCMFGREIKLKHLLTSLREEYEYILLDCPPTLTMLTLNALVAADSVLIPCQAQHLSTAGLVELLKTVNMVRQQKINPALEIEGVLMTMYDERTNMSRNTAQAVREAYAQHIRIFDSMIPMSVRAREATCDGVSIYRHDPKGKIAAALSRLSGVASVFAMSITLSL